MTGEIGLPAIDGFATVDMDLERNVAMPTNDLARTVQRLVRDGDRWACTLQFPPAQGDEAGVIGAFMRELSRGDRWAWLSPPQNDVRGNWSPADLITNGTFLGGTTTGWTAQNSAVLSVNARRLKVLNGAAASGRGQQDVVMEVGKPHVLIADAGRGKSTAAQAQIVRQSDSGIEANTGAIIAPERMVLLCTPSVAAMQARLILNDAVAGNDVRYYGVSLTRCLQVAGAGQVGNRLNVDGGPASMNAALKAGEFVCFPVGSRYQLVQLVEDFDTDAGGAGALVFEPVLRGSPADNAAVIVRYPFGRFLLPGHSSAFSVRAPNFHGYSIGAVEDVTP